MYNKYTFVNIPHNTKDYYLFFNCRKVFDIMPVKEGVMFKLFCITVLLFSFLNANNQNSVNKGLTYYKYILKPLLGYDGLVFTKKYTQKEWETLFENDAKEFIALFGKESQEVNTFLHTPKFKSIANDVKSFAVYYAKDSTVSPHCE